MKLLLYSLESQVAISAVVAIVIVRGGLVAGCGLRMHPYLELTLILAVCMAVLLLGQGVAFALIGQHRRERRLRLFQSNYGSHGDWQVEHDGESVALLTQTRMEKMFWVSYRIQPLVANESLKERIISDQSWWLESRLTYRSVDLDEVAPLAFVSGCVFVWHGRVSLRGLYFNAFPPTLWERIWYRRRLWSDGTPIITPQPADARCHVSHHLLRSLRDGHRQFGVTLALRLIDHQRVAKEDRAVIEQFLAERDSTALVDYIASLPFSQDADLVQKAEARIIGPQKATCLNMSAKEIRRYNEMWKQIIACLNGSAYQADALRDQSIDSLRELLGQWGSPVKSYDLLEDWKLVEWYLQPFDTPPNLSFPRRLNVKRQDRNPFDWALLGRDDSPTDSLGAPLIRSCGSREPECFGYNPPDAVLEILRCTHEHRHRLLERPDSSTS